MRSGKNLIHYNSPRYSNCHVAVRRLEVNSPWAPFQAPSLSQLLGARGALTTWEPVGEVYR